MSLSAIINAGQSALIAAQTQMSVASTNITNASTEGYTTKTASTATTTVSGQAVGVAVTAIGNQISAALQAEVMSAASEARYDETLAAYLETALTALGTTSSGAPLEEAMTALSDALAEAVSDGGTTSATAAVADALAVWAETLNTTAADLEAVARTVESDLAKSVDSVNALLQTLDTLNDQITAATAAGRSTADLLDSQRSALEELSGYLDIASYTASSGDLYIYSADGQALLTSTPRTLSYDAAGGIAIDGEDVGTKLGGGSIGALLELHDTVLPGLQDELDSLAVTVMEAVNAAANAASPVPAPATLTSAGTLDAAAAFA
ncbi:MAG: hypothetical protein KDA49_13675, partial [Rhodospirillaceae bacterium]|nr:hypothetical protein [Rhodospirillaceae bacterium]